MLQTKYAVLVAPTKATTRKTQMRSTSPSQNPNRRASPRRKRNRNRKPKYPARNRHNQQSNRTRKMLSIDAYVAISERFGDAK